MIAHSTDPPAPPPKPPPVPLVPPAPRPGATAPPGTDETVKETLEALVIAFILAFVFRAFVVEAFIIPTGSMAPTLLGKHVSCECPSCGYQFDGGLRGGPHSGQPLMHDVTLPCPMCRYPVQRLAVSRMASGDRILVDKFTYSFTDPKRWDVVVFKNPQAYNDDGPPPTPGPRNNFIKRLVGLPGEQLYLLDGDVYTAPIGSDTYTIACKTDPAVNPHWERIQHNLWQPVYHSQYVPLVSGRPGRADGTVDQARTAANAWEVPWAVTEQSTGQWDLGSGADPKRHYRFEGGQGEIRFDFRRRDRHSRTLLGFPLYAYNRNTSGGYNDSLAGSGEPIEDIRLGVAAMPADGPVSITLSTTARLDVPEHGTETLHATINEKGTVTVSATRRDGQTRRLGQPVHTGPLPAGVATPLELWVVDQQVSVWVDGRRVYRYDYDLSWDQVLARPRPDNLPDVRIAVDSANPVLLHRVELDRDVYYGTGWSNPSGGGIHRRHTGQVPADLPDPVVLREQTADHDAELYVLGDNTADSEDSRKWSDVNGWVQARHFGGEHRPQVVPRGLLVGRAFFVYYPAPQPATLGGGGVIPDFGRMRFIH